MEEDRRDLLFSGLWMLVAAVVMSLLLLGAGISRCSTDASRLGNASVSEISSYCRSSGLSDGPADASDVFVLVGTVFLPALIMVAGLAAAWISRSDRPLSMSLVATVIASVGVFIFLLVAAHVTLTGGAAG